MIAFIAIFTALGLFFSALLLCLAIIRVVTRLGTWPARPMDNQERKAAWALKYHQATPITPNSRRWKWLPPITQVDLLTWAIPPHKGNDHE